MSLEMEREGRSVRTVSSEGVSAANEGMSLVAGVSEGMLVCSTCIIGDEKRFWGIAGGRKLSKKEKFLTSIIFRGLKSVASISGEMI
jgi:hypothetical protein